MKDRSLPAGLRRRSSGGSVLPGSAAPKTLAGTELQLALTEVPARQVFQDPDLEIRFRSHGFVITRLFDEIEASEIVADYLALGGVSPDEPEGDDHELLRDDDARKRVVQAVLRPRFEARASDLFVDYSPRATAFIRKPSGDSGDSEPHMDPSFIDESTSRSVMIWCSLTGVRVGGGLLWFVPGSHRLGPRRRAHLDPINSFCELVDDITGGLGMPAELAPGEAVIFDHSTMHWADPNSSGVTKLVAQSALAPREQPLRYVYAAAPGVGHEYAIDDDFFLLFPLDSKPGHDVLHRYQFLGEVELAITSAGRAEFESLSPR